MSKKMGVAELKRHFSAVVSKVSLNREHYIIEKKGRPMAAMVSVEDLEIIEGLKKGEKRKGLLAAIGAWEDFDNFEKIVATICERRKGSKDRDVGGLP
jgi:prevent-host-death family protein